MLFLRPKVLLLARVMSDHHTRTADLFQRDTAVWQRLAADEFAGAFTAHRETDFGRQRRRAPIRFRTVFVSRRDRERATAPSHAPGKRFLDARDRRPRTASEAGPSSLQRLQAGPAPRKTAGYSSNHGKSRLAWECVVGPGGLEPATRRLSAPAGKFRIRRAQTRHRRWSQKGLAFCCEPSGSVVVLG
jgi:hypothetical protein